MLKFITMKKYSFFLFLLFIIATASAQEEPETPDSLKTWKYGGLINLSLSQVGLSDTWMAGGASSVSGNGSLNLFLNYKEDKRQWQNTLELGYGLIRQELVEDKYQTRKTDDKFDFASKYGRKASKNWFYSALLNFKTQFTDGYDYPNDSVYISRFLSPAYLNFSIGMDYNPNEVITVFISPLSYKLTVVSDKRLSDDGTYGVEPGNKSRSEAGASMSAVFKKDLMENVNLRSKLELFTNYKDKLGEVDLNWEVLLSMKINEYLSANANFQLIYDEDMIPDIQWKEVIGVGFSYKF